MNVRNMQEADFNAVLSIQAHCYHAITPESLDSIRAKQTASPLTCFVACDQDNQVAGYILSIPWVHNDLPELNAPACLLPAQPDCLYLHDLAVNPRYQGSGVGRHLVQVFWQALQKTGLSAACLVAIQNSVPYWQKQGFMPAQPQDALQRKLRSYGQQAVYMAWHQ